MFWKKEEARAGRTSRLWLSVHSVVLFQLVQYLLSDWAEACSHDYVKNLPKAIPDRLDHADIAVFGHVRSTYPYPGTNDYVARLDVLCILKAEPERIRDGLSHYVGNLLNISHAGDLGGRDSACILQRDREHDYVVFLTGSNVYDLTLSSPPIRSIVNNRSVLNLAATACSYTKPEISPDQAMQCPDPEPAARCPTRPTTLRETTITDSVSDSGHDPDEHRQGVHGSSDTSKASSSTFPHSHTAHRIILHIFSLVVTCVGCRFFMSPLSTRYWF